MESVARTDVNITDIKYDNDSNSLLIQRRDESKWTIECKNVIRLTEDIDDVAPFFICDYLEPCTGYAIFKALKVFTVFVEREGVLHLRKYDNLIKKIKTGRVRDGRSFKKVILMCDHEDEGAFLEVFNDAGVELELVKPMEIPRLDKLKKADVDEVVSLKALDIPPFKDLLDAEDLAKPKETRLVNGEVACTKEIDEVDDDDGGVKDGADHDVNAVVLNGIAGIEEVRNVGEKREESVEEKSDAKNELDHAEKSESLIDREEVETIGSSSVATKKPGDLKRKDHSQRSLNLDEAIYSSSRMSESGPKSWHWSYYLIPAALIAILAISLHLFRDKNHVGDA